MIKNSKDLTQETLYNLVLKRNTMTNKEITDQFNNRRNAKYIYIKYINPLLKQGKLDRIRRGLYTAIDPLTESPVADPILVASKLREDYYLGYYTALVLYGAAHSTDTQYHVCLKPQNRLREFSYNGIHYVPIYTQDTETDIQTRNHKGRHIRVCSKDRLLIELVDSPDNVGGWEQTLKSLESLGGINYKEVPPLLTKLGNQRLIRKTGYILETLRQHSIFHSHLSEETLEKLHSMVQGQPYYLEKNNPGPLNKRWLLYIPSRFNEYLRGI